jgi:hypothetical protein
MSDLSTSQSEPILHQSINSPILTSVRTGREICIWRCGIPLSARISWSAHSQATLLWSITTFESLSLASKNLLTWRTFLRPIYTAQLWSWSPHSARGFCWFLLYLNERCLKWFWKVYLMAQYLGWPQLESSDITAITNILLTILRILMSTSVMFEIHAENYMFQGTNGNVLSSREDGGYLS